MKRVVGMWALAAIVGTACSSGPNIEIDYDPASAGKIASYKTFSWMPAPAGYQAIAPEIQSGNRSDHAHGTEF